MVSRLLVALSLAYVAGRCGLIVVRGAEREELGGDFGGGDALAAMVEPEVEVGAKVFDQGDEFFRGDVALLVHLAEPGVQCGLHRLEELLR